MNDWITHTVTLQPSSRKLEQYLIHREYHDAYNLAEEIESNLRHLRKWILDHDEPTSEKRVTSLDARSAREAFEQAQVEAWRTNNAGLLIAMANGYRVTVEQAEDCLWLADVMEVMA